ncbi:hypothetical protein ACJX0J_031589 [Zea mays]
MGFQIDYHKPIILNATAKTDALLSLNDIIHKAVIKMTLRNNSMHMHEHLLHISHPIPLFLGLEAITNETCIVQVAAIEHNINWQSIAFWELRENFEKIHHLLLFLPSLQDIQDAKVILVASCCEFTHSLTFLVDFDAIMCNA